MSDQATPAPEFNEWYDRKADPSWERVAEQPEYPFTQSYYVDEDYKGTPRASGLEVYCLNMTGPYVRMNIQTRVNGEHAVAMTELTFEQTQRLAKHLTDWCEQQIEVDGIGRVPFPVAREIAAELEAQS